MKRLILMRHAKSSWATPGQDDHARPLNGRGKVSARVLGEWLTHHGYIPDLTLSSDSAVGAQLKIFARVDDLVTQGNTTVVLDRGQTSVTALSEDGTEAEQALRAGDGATTMAADSAGRVLVADTRGDQLLVFGTDPLILRQMYPVRDAPYGLAGTATLAWVSQTASNSVVGYDLSTGIPVEKVRYRTVQQPNLLVYDESSGTLYVVSGSGAGVQVIPGAAVGS